MVDYKKQKQFSYVRGIAVTERRLFMERNKMANRTTAAISEEEFIMKPYIDWCFKELMRNPNTRRGFIAELLELSPEQIGNTIILENELPKRSEEEKKGVLDVHVLLENGTQLDIEMQVVYMEYWDDRSLFYLCKMFSSQLCKGEEYDRLQKCVHVSVLNFTYYKKDDICYRKAQVYDKATGELYSDKLELQILELPKIPEEYHHPDGIIAWMKFFRGGKKEDLKEMAKGNTYLEEAYEDLMEMSQDEEKRRAYEARERALRDQLSLQRQAERAFQRMTNAQEKLEEIQGKLDETQGKLDETQGKLDETQGKLDETQGKLDVAQDNLADMQERFSESQKQLEKARAEKDAAHDQGRKDAVIELYQKGFLNLEQAASEYGISIEDFRKLLV